MTMHHIAGITATAGQSNINFSSLPQNFTHIQVRISGRSANTSGSFGSVYSGFNGEVFTGTSYTHHNVSGEGSSTAVLAQASQGQLNIGGGFFPWSTILANVQASLIIDILDYSSTSKNKTIKYIMGWDANGSGRAMFGSGMRMNTAAINEIYFSPDAGFTAGSRLDVYGITNNPIAMGA
jgi:hypothetical protein